MIASRASNAYNNVLTQFAEWSDRAANKRWYNSPLGLGPHAAKEDYLRLAQQTKDKEYPIVGQFEAECGFAIDQKWMDQLALHTQIIIKPQELCYQHGRVLYSSLRRYLSLTGVPRISIVETGTARGFSSLCMAKALEDTGIEGRIITFDVLPHHQKMYWNCIDDLEGPKSRRELLREYSELTDRYIVFHQGNSRVELPKVQMDRVNFAFLDGAHTYRDVLLEFASVREAQQPGDVVVFDDYTPEVFSGIVKAVDEICRVEGYQKEVFTISRERGYVVATKQG